MSHIFYFVHAGGWMMYPLLLLSLIAFAVIVERGIAFRQMGDLAPGLLTEVIQLCKEEYFEQALQVCRARRGPLASCLAVILLHRELPVSKVERWVEETGQEYFTRLEHFLPLLDTATTIAPLMGLLGTILGMIGAFNAISLQQSHGNNDAVLRGVAEALYATASGIMIAVICFIAYNYFAARLRTITAETEMASTRLLNLLSDSHFHGEQISANSQSSGEGDHAVQTTARAETHQN